MSSGLKMTQNKLRTVSSKDKQNHKSSTGQQKRERSLTKKERYYN
jgi:hypothetical protein